MSAVFTSSYRRRPGSSDFQTTRYRYGQAQQTPASPHRTRLHSHARSRPLPATSARHAALPALHPAALRIRSDRIDIDNHLGAASSSNAHRRVDRMHGLTVWRRYSDTPSVGEGSSNGLLRHRPAGDITQQNRSGAMVSVAVSGRRIVHY